MSARSLGERLLAIDAALDAATIPHAFGGAIALAFYTLDPRGTSDLDLNVFVSHLESRGVLAALPPGVTVPDDTAARIGRDGQVRVFWDEMPLDLFFDTVPFHTRVRDGVIRVPFMGREIPILGAVELAVFKASFDRTKDWADIEAMVESEHLDVGAVRNELHALLGDDDHRIARLDEAVRRGRAARDGDRR